MPVTTPTWRLPDCRVFSKPFIQPGILAYSGSDSRRPSYQSLLFLPARPTRALHGCNSRGGHSSTRNNSSLLDALPATDPNASSEAAAVLQCLAGLDIHSQADGRHIVPILRPEHDSLPFGMALELHAACVPSAAARQPHPSSADIQPDLYVLHYILSGCGEVVESGRPIQDLQPGDSVLLPYGKASCRARPGCQPCSTGLGPSWAMASLTLLVPATLALDYGGSQAGINAAAAAIMAAWEAAPACEQLSEEAVIALLASAAAASEPSRSSSRHRLPEAIRQLLRIGGRQRSQQHPPVLKRSLQDLDAFQLPNQTNRLALVFDPLSHAGVPFTFGVEIFTPDHRTSPHQHAVAHELFFILQGAGTGFCDGRRFPVQAGDVVVFPPGSLHGIDNGAAGSMFCLELMLPNDMFAEFVQQDSLEQALLGSVSYRTSIFTRSPMSGTTTNLGRLKARRAQENEAKVLTGSRGSTSNANHSAARSHLENDAYMEDFEAIIRLHEPGEPSLDRALASSRIASRPKKPSLTAHKGDQMEDWLPYCTDVLAARCSAAWRRGPSAPAGRLIQLSDQPLLCSAVSPDRSGAVFGSSDHALYTVDMMSGKKSRTLYGRSNGHAEWVSCCKYLPDGRIVSGAMDSKVCVWAAKGVSSQTLEGHSGAVSALEVLKNQGTGVLVASASYDKSIRLWQMDMSGPSPASQLTGHKAPILQLKAGPGALASGDRSGGLAVWDLTIGVASWRALDAHDGHVTALTWSQSLHPTSAKEPVELGIAQREAGSAGGRKGPGSDGSVAVADPRAGSKMLGRVKLTDFPYSLTAVGGLAVCGCGDGSLHVIDAAMPATLYALGAQKAAVRTVWASGDQLVCSGDDGSVLCFDMAA
ncbi:hypothetical protein WJX84_004348 [Apatococcus fuscideae]|uniref:Cupin type-2 domain-containing protein n=1 Tax=Apatococcus fuscideae TaxID=2026836 RepID=A0AAW1SWG2_9CHLO